MDTTSPDPVIVARSLAKSYRGVIAVDDVSLQVDRGETLGILGMNGAGKTTTVEMIAGLRRPDRGSIRVMDLDPVHERSALRQVLGVQLQEAEMHGALKVTELIDLYRSFYPAPRPRAELLELVQLTDKAGTRFEKLSGGQQQRLSVALALAGRPQVLILDELTTGLDPAARRRMWRTIETLQAEGTTIILVSHAMDEVERLCDRIVLLDTGRVLASSTPSGLTQLTGAASLDDAFIHLTGQDTEVPE